MDSPHIDEFTSDGRSPCYSKTGLQTANKPPAGEQPSGGDLIAQKNEPAIVSYDKCKVTDLVTHLAISIHGITDQELERILPPPSPPQEPPEGDEGEDREERFREGMVMAACISGVATAAVTAVMFLWALAVVGSEGVALRAVEAAIGVVRCAMMGAATAVAVWVFTAGDSEEHSGFEHVSQQKPSKSQYKPPE
ncbi:hypothetical protein FN846DRAFT_908235 [Sphaerosporella brunnea]|uniref:Uncharacterized protein n=1 Tax=Sphaerosporella brunnea TaxID=1250544 RepID=A0A5J5EU02_9PEZI|nr:hypothetical protein FN846DRAFT_908235 [Sphaerosporella brunnea]